MYEIDRLDDFGRGITYVNGKITFVDNALDNELVELEIKKESKKYNLARAVEIENKSSERIENDCPYYFKCGGCNLRHCSLKKENEFKIYKVKNIIRKFANVNVENINIISENDYNYRNKITLRVKDKKIGLLEENSNNIINIDKCMIVDKKINYIINCINSIIDNKIEKIMIRIGNKTNDVMLDIFGKVNNVDDYKKISTSLIINNEVITNKYLNTYINEYLFHIRNKSFLQVNYEICEKLYNKIIEIVIRNKCENVLDLYCGVGTISICISKYVKNVLGVEIVKDAIIDANENKKINDINNVSFINDDVIKVLDLFNNYDTVVVDPPRKGLDKKLIDKLLEVKVKTIIYVSCDQVTFARDLNYLKEEYNIREIELYNMFPRTSHCESVCVLELK